MVATMEVAATKRTDKEVIRVRSLSDIEALPKEMLTVNDVYEFLECDPNVIRWQAREDPDKLGFPVIVMKSRVKIPKAGFLYYMKYGRKEVNCT